MRERERVRLRTGSGEKNESGVGGFAAGFLLRHELTLVACFQQGWRVQPDRVNRTSRLVEGPSTIRTVAMTGSASRLTQTERRSAGLPDTWPMPAF